MRIKIFILTKPNFNGFHVETVFKSIFRSNHGQFKDQQISHKWQRVEWHEANKNQHLKLGCWNFDVAETSESIPQKWSIKTILMQIDTSLWCRDPNRYQNETSKPRVELRINTFLCSVKILIPLLMVLKISTLHFMIDIPCIEFHKEHLLYVVLKFRYLHLCYQAFHVQLDPSISFGKANWVQ